MKKSLTILAFAAAMILAGCQREADSPDAGLKEIKFKASLDLETKVTATSFEEGDVIGLSIGDPLNVSRAKLTYTGGALTPEKTIFWPESMSYLDEATFIAWYPYGIFGSDPISNTVSFIVARDQYKEGEYESSDVLAALTSSSPSQDAVALEFHHLLSRFKIKVVDQLTSDSFSDVQSESFCSIGLNGLVRGAAANLVDGVVEADASSENVIYPMRASEKNYWAIVVPQTVTPEIVVTLNSGETRTYVPSAPITFTGGKQLSATLTLSDASISFQWNIVDWEEDWQEIEFIQPKGEQPDNEIWYTTTDGNIVTLTERYLSEFGANIISNIYSDGRGIITFDGPISRVAPDAFRGCKNLLTISLPESVTSLGYSCFSFCYSLESIYLPDGITVIEWMAFDRCGKLFDVVLPKNLVSIEIDAFQLCSSIVSLDIPDSLESLGENPFTYCTGLERFSGKFASQDGRCLIIDNTVMAFAPAGLTEYAIPADVTGVGDSAFRGADELKYIVIPDSVTEIGTAAFLDTESLESFSGAYATDDGRGLVIDGVLMGFAKHGLTSWDIPAGVTALGPHVFESWHELTNITIPQAVTAIGYQAFYDCTAMQTITIPVGVTTIEHGSFAYCESLKSITIPDGVTTIEYSAFEYCTSLQSITIPQSVEVIEDWAISGADSITDIYVLSTVPPVLYTQDITSSDFTIYVPAASVDAYKTARGWRNYADHIQPLPDGQPNNEIWYTSTDGNIVTLDERYLTEYGANFVSNTYEDGKGVIVFDGPIVSIPTYAFLSCENLASVSLPGTLRKIGGYAFYETALSEIELPNSLEYIGDGAFTECALTEITIPESVTYIGTNVFGLRTPIKAFYGKGASEDHSCLVWEGYLKGIANKNQVLDFVIPEGVRFIDRYLFDYYCNYNSITFPESLEGADYSPFSSPQRLSVFYGSNVSDDHRCLIFDGRLIGFAHYGLNSDTYTVPETVTVIGSSGFYNQNNYTLKELILPETVVAIEGSIIGLTRIERIHLPESLKDIGNSAFFAAYYLESITIPAGVESIGDEAFAWAGYRHGNGELDELTFLPAVPPAISEYTFYNLKYSGPFYVPAASVEAYKTAPYWSAYADRIQPISEEQPNNEIWYTSTDGNVVELYKDTGFGGAQLISNTYKRGKGILRFDSELTQFGDLAFFSCVKLKSVQMPESITSIGDQAFTYCRQLETVYIPASVSAISYRCFANCDKLSQFQGDLATPDGRCMIIKGVLVGFAPYGLTSYVLDNDILTIGDSALEGCDLLKRIGLPANLIEIKSQAFSDCHSLESIVLPETVQKIGQYAFIDCKSLTTVNIPESLTTLSRGAFARCGALGSFTGKYATADGRSLIVDDVLMAVAPAGLETFMVPSGVIGVEFECFSLLPSLKSVVLPASITFINEYAINHCKSLESIVIEAETVPTGVNKMINDTNNCPIYVPAASVEAYKGAEYWSAYADRIQAIVE